MLMLVPGQKLVRLRDESHSLPYGMARWLTPLKHKHWYAMPVRSVAFLNPAFYHPAFRLKNAVATCPNPVSAQKRNGQLHKHLGRARARSTRRMPEGLCGVEWLEVGACSLKLQPPLPCRFSGLGRGIQQRKQSVQGCFLAGFVA